MRKPKVKTKGGKLQSIFTGYRN
ncbi:hypothetical protein CAEBREN_06230 [Caenorhabditis brenneri]|uniref:Uncharacterized protein n=1 Tax=Caenorhabditis brenneri TaxID=135651 RepID=G0MXA8_CAEBE|nr:hypothetical protein CAEBREN_06230 [Caenorhabditis brenneri]